MDHEHQQDQQADGGGREPHREPSPGKQSLISRTFDAPVQRRAVGKRSLVDETFGSPVQRKETGAAGADVHEAAARGTQGPGGSLPHLEAIQRSFGRFDVGGIQAHTDGPAQQASRDMGAAAFATGNHVAFAGAPDLHTTAHEAAHVVQQRAGVHLAGGVGAAGDAYERHADAVADQVVAGRSAEGLLGEMAGGAGGGVQRKEVATDAEITGPQDWTKADREGNAPRWQAACLRNLNAVDSSQYVKVVERRDFYHWFYEYTASLRYQTRWALAAYVVANGAHQIADMDEDHAWANDGLKLANVELQGAMREGNQVIFDNVLPKLKKLLDGGPLRGRAALQWDMQILAEEQNLIQPMYAAMSPQTRAQLDYIARKKRFAGLGARITGDDKVAKGPYNNPDRVPGFDQPDLQNASDRWTYGMKLGDRFTPGGSGFDPAADKIPSVSSGYTDGGEFGKVDTRHHLHELDAWLNPNRLTRVKGDAGSDLQPIIDGLSDFEKRQVLTDVSADGWAYSKQFAQFGSITEAMVQKALPADPASAGAVAGFLGRYRTERAKVVASTPPIMMPPF
jgi:Domain of unknown function (DUF4157)